MAEGTFELTLDKVISGQSPPIKLGFCITSIGDEDEPEFDNYLYSIKLASMTKPDLKEGLELKAENKKFTGDVTWNIKRPIEEEGPEGHENEGYTIPHVTLKTFENGDPMAKATMTFPFQAVIATKNWKD